MGAAVPAFRHAAHRAARMDGPGGAASRSSAVGAVDGHHFRAGEGQARLPNSPPRRMVGIAVSDLLLPLWIGGALVFIGWRIREYVRMRRDLLEDSVPVGDAGKVRLVETPAVDRTRRLRHCRQGGGAAARLHGTSRHQGPRSGDCARACAPSRPRPRCQLRGPAAVGLALVQSARLVGLESDAQGSGGSVRCARCRWPCAV